MKPSGKGDVSDVTAPEGKPLSAEDLADLENINEPTLNTDGGGPNPLPYEPTVNVTPDAGLVNDPRRVVRPSVAGPDDPTKNVLPERLQPPRPQPLPATSEPTVNVTPDLAVVNDPNRVLEAREAAAAAPTVNVVPDLAVVNDPNRVIKARDEAAAAPTVNVVPDPALHNDPNRLLWARELPPDPPTVTAPPPLAAPPTPASGLLWLRDEPESAPTVTTAPDGPREPTLRTDPDPSLPPPLPAESTVQLDLPAEAKVLTSARAALSPAARSPVPLGEESHPGHVVLEPRPSPQKGPKLDGVAPLVPIQHFPHVGPALDVTARTDPPTQYGAGPPPGVPVSMLAAPEPAKAPTVPLPPPVSAWKASPEVQAFEQDELDRTRVMSKVTAPGAGLRPPGWRDMAVIGAGFVLLCVGMVLARRDTHEGRGPLPAEKIEPPAGFVAPKPVKESTPYVAPGEKSAESRFTTVMKGGGGSGSAAADAPAQAPASGGVAPPPTRLATPRCHVNVPASLEAKARWVTEGKKKLIELKVTPTRSAIQRANLFISSASHPEHATLERTENAAVYFVVLLDPEPNKKEAKVVLDCECGLATAEVLATIEKKDLKVELKPAKVTPPEVLAAKARIRR